MTQEKRDGLAFGWRYLLISPLFGFVGRRKKERKLRTNSCSMKRSLGERKEKSCWTRLRKSTILVTEQWAVWSRTWETETDYLDRSYLQWMSAEAESEGRKYSWWLNVTQSCSFSTTFYGPLHCGSVPWWPPSRREDIRGMTKPNFLLLSKPKRASFSTPRALVQRRTAARIAGRRKASNLILATDT